MPGPAELSRGPLSPNACRGLGHWCWVSGQIGFSPGSPADAALLQGWPGGQKEASAPSSSWTPRGTWRPLSVVLDGGGPQVRALWTPAHAGGHAVGSVMRELAPLAQQRAFLPVVGCCWGRGVAFSHPHPNGENSVYQQVLVAWTGSIYTWGGCACPKLRGHRMCVNMLRIVREIGICVCTGGTFEGRWGC